MHPRLRGDRTQLVHGQAKPTSPLDGTLSHVSFAVTDVEKTAKAFGAVFGVSVPAAHEARDIPWGAEYPGRVMNGKLTSFVVNGVRFEFIQPLDGESPWKDFIKKNGDGIHHIGFEVKDVAAARKALQAKGGETIRRYRRQSNVRPAPHLGGLPQSRA